MTTRHSETITDIVEASSYAGEVYRGPPSDDTADRAVFCWPDGDYSPPDGTFVGDEGDEYRTRYTVRIRANDYQTAEADGNLLKGVLTDADAPGYLRIHLQNGPFYIGEDEADRPEFSGSVLLWLIE